MNINHIGIVTDSLARSIEFYKKLGFDAKDEHEDLVDKFRGAVIEVDGLQLLLMEPTDPEGPIGRYLAKRGPGFHHMAFQVPDCRNAFRELRDKGVDFFWEEPREQSYEVGAFIKPSSAGGVLIEIVEPKP